MTETEGALLDFRDLLSVELKGDNVLGYINDWDLCLLSMKNPPQDEDILESLFSREIRKSSMVKGMLDIYDADTIHKGVAKSYSRLRTMVKTHLEHRQREKVLNEKES